MQEAVRPPVYWRLRHRISPDARALVRRWVDRVGGPLLGSINGGRTADEVALTFDDGPDEHVTRELLDTLRAHDASATFFVLVVQARIHPDLVRRMVQDGHEVALHGLDHRRITDMSFRVAVSYLRSARAELEDLAGASVRGYRPPFGSLSLRSWLAARAAGLSVVVWSCDGEDWVDRDVDDVVNASLARLSPGGVLLLHERLEPDPGRDAPTTSFDRAEMTSLLLRELASRGMRAVTVASWMSAGTVRRTVWFRP